MPPGSGWTQFRQQDGEAIGRPVQAMVAPSQGVHLVVDRDFLPGDHALMVPKTADGRVLFGVPWLGKVILGTTDTPRDDLALEPRPFREELAFILSESARYLTRAPAGTISAVFGSACGRWSSRRARMATTPRGSAASTRCWSAAAAWSP